MTKTNRSVRMSEDELEDILAKNKGLKVSSQTPLKKITPASPLDDKALKKIKKDEKVKDFLSGKLAAQSKEKENFDDFFSSGKTSEKPVKKAKGINVKENIIELNKKSVAKVVYGPDHISILFEGARLLSLNQIFAILQYRKYEVFAYKKMWQELMKNALMGKNNLPFFDKNCEIVLLRYSPKLVDRDSLSTMYKYIIDSLRVSKKDKNHKGILSEDNPNVVENIKLIQQKSKENYIGIRIQRIPPQSNREITPEEFLNSKENL